MRSQDRVVILFHSLNIRSPGLGLPRTDWLFEGCSEGPPLSGEPPLESIGHLLILHLINE
jgi:hypothetical protein